MKITKRAQDTAEVIALVVIKAKSVKDAADELGKSERTIKRYLKKFREEGIEGLNYRSHTSWNRTNETTENIVVEIKNERSNRSCLHIKHFVYERTGKKISRSTIWCILKRKHEDITTKEKTESSTEPIKPYEMKRFGDMWQIDTTEGYWLKGYGKIYLILIIDDYSRGILAGVFALKDDTASNMLAIRMAIEKYLVPHSIKADNDSKFKPLRKKDKEQGITEIKRACNELGAVLFTHKPYNAKSKGKIEKRFQFIDDWFIKENDFKDLEDMNSKFEVWTEWFNNDHVVESTKATPKSRFENSNTKPLPEGVDLDDIFCFKETRLVRRDATISYKGNKYEIGAEYMGKEVTLHITPDKNKIRIWHDKKLIKIINLKNRAG